MRLVLVLLAACNPPREYTLDDLPVEEWTAGLPVAGDGKLVTVLEPREPSDWSNVRGFATFRCDGCTLGDDRARMKLESFDDTFAFGHLTFDTVHARVEFRDGHFRLTSQWRSPDFTLDADIHGILANRADDIRLAGCVVFRPEPALAKRDPKLHSLISVTGAPFDGDGRFYIRIGGTLGEMKRLAEYCSL